MRSSFKFSVTLGEECSFCVIAVWVHCPSQKSALVASAKSEPTLNNSAELMQAWLGGAYGEGRGCDHTAQLHVTFYNNMAVCAWLCLCVGVTPFRAPWESAGIHSLCWHMGRVTTSNPGIVAHWDTWGRTNNNGWVIEDGMERFLLRGKRENEKIIQRMTEDKRRHAALIQIIKSVKITRVCPRYSF